MKRTFYHTVAAVILLTIAFVILFWLLKRPQPLIADVCETENPTFNAAEACKNLIAYRYPSKSCTFTLGPRKDLPMGSCTECRIKCK